MLSYPEKLFLIGAKNVCIYDGADKSSQNKLTFDLSKLPLDSDLSIIPKGCLKDIVNRLEKRFFLITRGTKVSILPKAKIGEIEWTGKATDFLLKNVIDILRESRLRRNHYIISKIKEIIDDKGGNNQTNISVSKETLSIIENLSKLWEYIENSDVYNRKRRFEDLLKFMSIYLNFEIKDDSYEYRYGFNIFKISFKNLPIQFPKEVFIFYSDAEYISRTKDELDLVFQLLSDFSKTSENKIINLIGKYNENYMKQVSTATSKAILMHEIILKNIFLAKSIQKGLATFLTDNITLTKANPYHFDGPVMDDTMFFGREAETEEILANDNRNFAIYGSRRVGKTSLLMKLSRIFRDRGNCKIYYIPCSDMNSTTDLIERMVLNVNPKRKGTTGFDNFYQFIMTTHSHAKQRFVFILDEIDRIIVHSKNYGDDFFATLRDLSQVGVMQVIFSGFRTLYQEWRNDQSAFYNFATPIHLSSLDDTSSRNLMTIPMYRIGIDYSDQAIIDSTLEETGRYPCLIQFYCSRLLSLLDRKTKSKNIITFDEFELLHEEQSFRDKIFQTFDSEANLKPLEKIIVLTMVQDNINKFGHPAVIESLKKSAKNHGIQLNLDIDLILEALLYLETSNILIGAGKEYLFKIPVFPKVLSKYRNVSALIGDYWEKYFG